MVVAILSQVLPIRRCEDYCEAPNSLRRIQLFLELVADSGQVLLELSGDVTALALNLLDALCHVLKRAVNSFAERIADALDACEWNVRFRCRIRESPGRLGGNPMYMTPLCVLRMTASKESVRTSRKMLTFGEVQGVCLGGQEAEGDDCERTHLEILSQATVIRRSSVRVFMPDDIR